MTLFKTLVEKLCLLVQNYKTLSRRCLERGFIVVDLLAKNFKPGLVGYDAQA